MKLILLRHGESEWNLLNKFTGWTDIGLTKNGINEAQIAAEKLLQEKLIIKSINTSVLDRAIQTAEIVSNIIGFNKKTIYHKWRLNERHYGALQGLNKSETAKKYGEEKVHLWRRSYDILPPLLNENDERHPKFYKKFKNIKNELPLGESLKEVIERLEPFWNDYKLNTLSSNSGDHLIVAHSNSLRAIIKMLENLSKNEIVTVNIPTGVPLVYELSKDLEIKSKKYLLDEKALLKKQQSIINQGKCDDRFLKS
jgi:2,3-bisphosphoglycerate-dependent phosphoglycerate mutase